MNRVEKIIYATAKQHGVSVRTLMGDSRRSEVVALRRAVAIKLADDLKMTYSAIGRTLNRDPSRICKLISEARP